MFRAVQPKSTCGQVEKGYLQRRAWVTGEGYLRQGLLLARQCVSAKASNSCSQNVWI